MAKPERQQGSGVSLFIDGIVAKRVQSVTVDVDITLDPTKELANEGVVQNVREDDSVTIDIETNHVGSTDNLALIADKMITYGDAVATAGPRNNWDGAQHKWFIRTDSSNASYRSIQASDLLNNFCNILVAVNEESTAVARTMWAPRCAITNLSLSFDVNGNATENYSLLSDKKIWFWNTQKSVRFYKPINNQIKRDFTDSTISFVGLNSCLPLGATVAAVLLNDRVVHAGQVQKGGTWDFGNLKLDDTNSGASAFSITHISNNGLPFSTPWIDTTNSSHRGGILWYGGLTDVDWEADVTEGYELESTAGALGGIRKGQIKAFLFNRGTDSKKTSTSVGSGLRLQTVSIDVPLGEDRLTELGRTGHYAVSKQSPVPVNITITANDTDIEYFVWLTATSIAQTDVAYRSSESFTNGNDLIIEIYKDTEQTTLLETITIGNMDVQTESFTGAVESESTQEITFTADNILIQGSGTSVVGGWDF